MSAAIVSQLVLIVGLLAVGYVCRKVDLLDEVASQKLSKLLLSLTIPATAIDAAIGQPLDNIANVLAFLGIAAAVFTLVPLLSKPLCRLLGWDETWRLLLTFGNTGFVGIPVCAAVLGNESVFYVTMFMLAFNVTFFTWGVATMKRAAGYRAPADADAQTTEALGDRAGNVGEASGEDGALRAAGAAGTTSTGRRARRRGSGWWRDLLSPGVVSAFLALAIFLLQIPVQADLARLVETVASINTPLAMIVIGASLASVPLRDIFNDVRLYLLIAIKMVVFPAILLVVLRLVGVDALLIGIFVILECMPVAGNLSMIAIQYDGDIALVSKATALTTLIFIPMVLAWTAVLGVVL